MIKTHLSFILLVLFIIQSISFLAGCGQPPSSPEKRSTVKVVGSQWYGHIPVWVGIEQGIFKKHGFDIEWQIMSNSDDRINAISKGQAHFASLGGIAMISAMARRDTMFYWVGNQDNAPGFEGLVAAKGVHSIKQLRGKKIGFPFGSSVELTCRMLLKQNGIDPDKDVKLVDLKVNEVPAAFRSGEVDAALIWEPGFSELLNVKDATVLGRDTDTVVYEKFKTMTGPDVLIINKSWADTDTVRAKRFLKAYFESVTWTKENLTEAISLVQGKYIQQDLSIIQKNMPKIIWHELEDQTHVMSDKEIFGQAAYIIDILYGEMDIIPEKPDFHKWVNLDLLPLEDIGNLN